MARSRSPTGPRATIQPQRSHGVSVFDQLPMSTTSAREGSEAIAGSGLRRWRNSLS
ncbi:hypothetical protein [Modestobacter sp. I12A-02662]|uniref:hypothetical protein n=1 Tax=Modestobacter sp. I12A-02662 TaxID=1730496 RepID=UPI0034DF56FB